MLWSSVKYSILPDNKPGMNLLPLLHWLLLLLRVFFLESARPPLDPFSSKHSSYGGICLFYRTIFSVSVDSSFFHFDTFECLFTAFKFNSFNFNLVIFYRPPSSSLPHFLDDFYQLCESLYSLSLPFHILGDFNISFNKNANFYVLKLFGFLSTFNLTQHCNFPTYRLGNTLEFFISSSYSKISNLFSEPVNYSDRHFISLKLHFTTPPYSQFLNICCFFYPWFFSSL